MSDNSNQHPGYQGEDRDWSVEPGAVPGLGAVAFPLKFQTTISGTTYEFASESVTAAPHGSETRRSLTGIGTWRPVGPPPPPPPPPPAGISVSPTALDFGGMIVGQRKELLITVTNNDAAAATVSFSLAGASNYTIPNPQMMLPGHGSGALGVNFFPTAEGAASGSLRMVAGTQMITVPLTGTGMAKLPPPPPPPVGKVWNAKTDGGAKGNGVTVDVAAIQQLITRANFGDTLFFPAGTYQFAEQGPVKLNHKSLKFIGEQDAVGNNLATLVCSDHDHFWLGTGGEPIDGLRVANLNLAGKEGGTMKMGDASGGIQIFGPNGAVIEGCNFRWCQFAVNVVAVSKGTIIRNNNVQGWGKVCFFLNGGERVTNNHCVQLDPDLFGEATSHGVYIHSGCDDVILTDCYFEGARKYGTQVYGEQLGTTTTNVQFIRCIWNKCANGVILAHSQMGAADAKNILFQDCQILDTYLGSSLAIKNGMGVVVRGCKIIGNSGASHNHTGACCYTGNFAPYEPNFTVSDVLIENCTLSGGDKGLWFSAPNGGTLKNIVARNNQISGNRVNVDGASTPGVTVS